MRLDAFLRYSGGLLAFHDAARRRRNMGSGEEVPDF